MPTRTPNTFSYPTPTRTRTPDPSPEQALLNSWESLLLGGRAKQALPAAEAVVRGALDELGKRWLHLAEATEAAYGYGKLRLRSGESHDGYFRDGMRTGPGLWQRRRAGAPPRRAGATTPTGGEAGGEEGGEGEGEVGAGGASAAVLFATEVAAGAAGAAAAAAAAAAEPAGQLERVLGVFKAGRVRGLCMAQFADYSLHLGDFADSRATGPLT
jgi:hypothetical protein